MYPLPPLDTYGGRGGVSGGADVLGLISEVPFWESTSSFQPEQYKETHLFGVLGLTGQVLRETQKVPADALCQLYELHLSLERGVLDGLWVVSQPSNREPVSIWLWVKTNEIPIWGTHFRTYFSGDWDVHWGYDLSFDPWPCLEETARIWGAFVDGRAITPIPKGVFEVLTDT